MKRALVKVCHGKNDLIGFRTIGSVAGSDSRGDSTNTAVPQLLTVASY